MKKKLTLDRTVTNDKEVTIKKSFIIFRGIKIYNYFFLN